MSSNDSNWKTLSASISTEIIDCINRLPGVKAFEIQGLGLYIDDTQFLNSIDNKQQAIYRKFKKIFNLLWSTLEFTNNQQFYNKKKKIIPILSSITANAHFTELNLEEPFIDSFLLFLSEHPNYYNELLGDFINCRSTSKNSIILIPNDRGQKFSLSRDFLYEQDRTWMFTIIHGSINSFYKNWLVAYGLGFSSSLIVVKPSLSALLNPKALRLAVANSYENYGICMLCFEILNALFLLPEKKKEEFLDLTYSLLSLTFLYSLSYITKHKNFDCLKSADIFSNIARMVDRFRSYIPVILLNVEIVNGLNMYLFIWAMQNACRCLPPECSEYKISFFQSAQMMQQNQTVVGVNNDPLENNILECEIIGRNEASQILEKFSNRFVSRQLISTENESHISEQLQGLYFYYSGVHTVNNTTQSREHICNNSKCLNRFFQIEPYSDYQLVQTPHYPVYYSYHTLLRNMGLDEEVLNVNKKNGSTGKELWLLDLYYNIFQTDDYNDITFKKSNESIPWILYMVLSVDENDNLKSIYLKGNNLYSLKKYLDWHLLFFNIPCKLSSYDFSNRLGEDTMLLCILGHTEFIDETMFKST